MYSGNDTFLLTLSDGFEEEMSERGFEKFVGFINNDIAVEDVLFICYTGSLEDMLSIEFQPGCTA